MWNGVCLDRCGFSIVCGGNCFEEFWVEFEIVECYGVFGVLIMRVVVL